MKAGSLIAHVHVDDDLDLYNLRPCLIHLSTVSGHDRVANIIHALSLFLGLAFVPVSELLRVHLTMQNCNSLHS